VPDEQAMRLVILPLADEYIASNHNNKAMIAAVEMFNKRRNTPRVYPHLSGRAQARISLEVDVTVPNGLSHQIVRTVSENCQTLKVQSFGFEE
jgi:hypothetical protein